MPWIYISDQGGFPAGVTDDDSHEIAVLQSITTDVSQEPLMFPTGFGTEGKISVVGMLDARATMDFIVTDLAGWYETFRPFVGN